MAGRRTDAKEKEGGASLATTRSGDPSREYAQAKSGCATTRAKIRGAKYAQEKRWRPEGRRYDTKDGGHDIPAVARNLRYRAPTKREDGKVKSSLQNRRSEGQNMHRKRHGDVKSPLQMHAAWIGASLPHLFPASDIPSGRSSARMRTDPSTSVSPAMYFRRTSCSMTSRFARNT